MSAPNISLLGATYNSVAGVTLPKSGGGTATFPWVEGSQTINANGTVDVTSLAEVVVAVSGGGGSGLEYESGTWNPTSNIARGEINFTKTHTELPILIMLSDVNGDHSTTTYTNYMFAFINYYTAFGKDIPYSSSAGRYASVVYVFRQNGRDSTSNTHLQMSSLTGETASVSVDYYVTASGFKPYCGGTNRYWRSGRTYKWIAVWKP